jgi:hypothetical protein
VTPERAPRAFRILLALLAASLAQKRIDRAAINIIGARKTAGKYVRIVSTLDPPLHIGPFLRNFEVFRPCWNCQATMCRLWANVPGSKGKT